MRSLLLFGFAALSYGYMFDCLDQCECDTEDEVIHCHNGKRTQLALPGRTRLRGFPVIGLTYNNITRLPDEDVLISKFPDLKVVDVERNENFDCDSLDEYRQIKIISDCDKNASEVSKVPRVYRPTKDCDLACQADRHYRKLHEYVLQLWEIIKEKYENFDLDSTLRQIRDFFRTVVIKVNALGGDIKKRIDDREHPKALRAETQLGDGVHVPTDPPVEID